MSASAQSDEPWQATVTGLTVSAQALSLFLFEWTLTLEQQRLVELGGAGFSAAIHGGRTPRHGVVPLLSRVAAVLRFRPGAPFRQLQAVPFPAYQASPCGG